MPGPSLRLPLLSPLPSSLHPVVFTTLLIQNTLVLLCAVVLAVAFALHVSACADLLPFALTVVVVIILGSAANLATVANTIAVERDWVVVIADKNESALAGGL